MISVYKPYLNDKILNYVKDALDSTWISSKGYYLEAFKENLECFLGIENVVLTNSGTSATHLLAKALLFKYPYLRDIACPNNCYIAVWNSFLYDRIFNLKPADADLDTWNAKYDEVNADAILVVHNLGNIVNVDKFDNAIIVEDNCEGFLGKYNGVYSGTKSFASSLSFFANKSITSGEGGAFLTDDDQVFEYINSVKNQGQSNEKYIHDYIGYNYRMTNIQAALLYGQMEYIEEIKERKNEVYSLYKKLFSSIDDVSFQVEEQGTEHSKWMLSCRFERFNDTKALSLFLFDNGIETRPMFYPITKHKFLENIKCDTKNATLLNNQCLVFPSYPELTRNEIEYIVDKVKLFISNGL